MDLRQQILQILSEAREQIVSNIDSEGIKASGATQNSLKVEDRTNSIVLIQDGTGAPFETLQFGREGGKIPSGFVTILKQWITDKGIQVEAIQYKRKQSAKWQPKYTPQERGLMKAAGAMAHKISQVGTKRYSENNLNVYTEPINKAIEKLELLIVESIISEVRR